jgi:hypothetical protein
VPLACPCDLLTGTIYQTNLDTQEVFSKKVGYPYSSVYCGSGKSVSTLGLQCGRDITYGA